MWSGWVDGWVCIPPSAGGITSGGRKIHATMGGWHGLDREGEDDEGRKTGRGGGGKKDDEDEGWGKGR